MLADSWLRTTPSRALALLSETDWDFDVMMAYRSWKSFHENWSHTTRDNKIKFIEVTKVKRRQEGRILDDANAEAEEMFREAQEVAYRHGGDPTRPPDDDLETKVQRQAEQAVSNKQRTQTFGRK